MWVIRGSQARTKRGMSKNKLPGLKPALETLTP